jgi:cellulose/xylan binding protein with CBM9 domain
MRKCLPGLLVLAVMCACTSRDATAKNVTSVRQAFGGPVMMVPRPAAAPIIDGKLDDAAWKAATPVTLGYVHGGWQRPTQKTVARVLADEKAIYFAVQCDEANPKQMRVVAAGDLSRRNVGDTVEFFLDPRHNGKYRHYKRFHDYYHVIVGPDGATFYRGGPTYGKWKATIIAKTAKTGGGWTVEVAIPMKDLGITGTAIPDVWGLNICRQRPELGVALPKAARAGGRARFHPGMRPVDEPDKLRQGEFSAWAPTYDDYSYSDSMPFHHPEYFGHAVLAVCRRATPRPKQVFEIIYKSDFDAGKIGPWLVWRKGNPKDKPVLVDESFRGVGKSLTFPPGSKHTMRLNMPLKNLEHVNMVMTFRMTKDGRMYTYSRAPDNWQCGAHYMDVFLTKEAAAKRKATKRGGYSLFPPLNIYHTHADFLAWKPLGRLWKAPGGWALMNAHFSEPSIGSVMWPGTDWCILRMRLGVFRRHAGRNKGQRLVPRDMAFTGGLTFSPGPAPMRISDLVIFRGSDVEPPEQVTGVTVKRNGDKLVVSWDRAKDNTLVAYYKVFAGKTVVAETHQLSATIKAVAAPISVVAYDLYDNASVPSHEPRD